MVLWEKKLGHSLSPEIHNYIFDKLGVEAEYSLYEIEDGKDILKLMEEKGIKGFNITIPYKEIVMSQLDFISEEAEKIWSCKSSENKKMVKATDIIVITMGS